MVDSGIEHELNDDPSMINSPTPKVADDPIKITDHIDDDPNIKATTTAVSTDPTGTDMQHSSCCNPQLRTKLISWYFEYEFLVLIVVAILLAKAYPPIGAEYLKPDITATWIAVVLIFFLAGLSLKTSEFKNAMLNWRYNVLIQLYNFGVVSTIAYGVSRALQSSNVIGPDLADGMVVCSCMPMTISMVVV